MTCLKWQVRNDTFGMTCLKWHVRNDMLRITHSEWHVWNDTFLFLASIFFYFQNLKRPLSDNSTYLLIVCQQDDTYVLIKTEVTLLFFAPTIVPDILSEDGDHPIIQISFSDCLRMHCSRIIQAIILLIHEHEFLNYGQCQIGGMSVEKLYLRLSMCTCTCTWVFFSCFNLFRRGTINEAIWFLDYNLNQNSWRNLHQFWLCLLNLKLHIFTF